MMPDRLLARAEVQARCGLSRASIYRRLKAGEFPQPRMVGARAVRWLETEIDEWISSRPRSNGDASREA